MRQLVVIWCVVSVCVILTIFLQLRDTFGIPLSRTVSTGTIKAFKCQIRFQGWFEKPLFLFSTMPKECLFDQKKYSTATISPQIVDVVH